MSTTYLTRLTGGETLLFFISDDFSIRARPFGNPYALAVQVTPPAAAWSDAFNTLNRLAARFGWDAA